MEAELGDPNLGLLEKEAASGQQAMGKRPFQEGELDGSICRPKLGPWVTRTSVWELVAPLHLHMWAKCPAGKPPAKGGQLSTFIGNFVQVKLKLFFFLIKSMYSHCWKHLQPEAQQG